MSEPFGAAGLMMWCCWCGESVSRSAAGQQPSLRRPAGPGAPELLVTIGRGECLTTTAGSEPAKCCRRDGEAAASRSAPGGDPPGAGVAFAGEGASRATATNRPPAEYLDAAKPASPSGTSVKPVT